MNTNEKISRQNEKISRSLQVVAETERVALEIGDELDRNTETIEGIHGKVREVSTMTGTARRLIQGMEGGFVNNIKGFFVGPTDSSTSASSTLSKNEGEKEKR